MRVYREIDDFLIARFAEALMEIATLLREDPSGKKAVKVWEQGVLKRKNIDKWIADDLWEVAEEIAYPREFEER